MNMNDEQTVFPEHHKNVHAQESWLKRNGLWFIPLLIFVVGVPMICCGSFIFGVGWFAGLVTAPKEAAIAAMEQDARVTEKIGAEISSNNQVSFNNMQINNDNGFVEISFSVSGSNGNARVSGKMQLVNGVWGPERLVVTFDDGSKIILPEGVD